MVRPGGRADRIRRGLTKLVLVAAVVPIVACGGDDGGGPLVAPPQLSTEGTDAADAFVDQTFSVTEGFWHAGFFVELEGGMHFALEESDFLEEELRYFVSIDASFQNLGTESASFNSETVLMGDGSFYPTSFESDLPTVPGELSGDGTFVFEVEEGFDVDSATLVVGSGDENRTEVPLGPEGGELTTVEPVELDVSGELSLELLDLVLTSAELRADRPVDHTQVEEGKLALTVNFDAVSRRSGNWTIRAEDFALALPGGSAVVPEGSVLETLPGSEAGTTTSDLYLRFLVDDPADGDYSLRFTAPSWFVGEDGVTEGAVDLTVE